MIPFRLDIKVRRACHFSTQIQFFSNSTSPFPITGYTFESSIHTADGGALICAVTPTIVDATNGILQLDIAQATTGAIPTTNLSGIWDVVGKPTGGEWSPFVEGNVVIYSGATVP